MNIIYANQAEFANYYASLERKPHKQLPQYGCLCFSDGKPVGFIGVYFDSYCDNNKKIFVAHWEFLSSFSKLAVTLGNAILATMNSEDIILAQTYDKTEKTARASKIMLHRLGFTSVNDNQYCTILKRVV